MGNVHMEATQINYRGGSVKKSVEEAIKDAIELTPEQKTNINKIPTIEAAVATKAAQSIIAPEFDSEVGVYAIGDLVMYEGKLYEFTTAHETPGDWDSTEVTEKAVADEIGSLKSGLNDVNSNIIDLTNKSYPYDYINLDTDFPLFGIYGTGNITGTVPYTLTVGIGVIVLSLALNPDGVKNQVLIDPYNKKLSMRTTVYGASGFEWGAWSTVTLS